MHYHFCVSQGRWVAIVSSVCHREGGMASSFVCEGRSWLCTIISVCHRKGWQASSVVCEGRCWVCIKFLCVTGYLGSHCQLCVSQGGWVMHYNFCVSQGMCEIGWQGHNESCARVSPQILTMIFINPIIFLYKPFRHLNFDYGPQPH